jgi:hypothetical protein
MQNDNQYQSDQDVWKSQEKEQMDITMEALRIKARRYERENVQCFWLLLCLTPAAVAWICHGIYTFIRLHRPVLVVTESWLLVTFCCIMWRLLHNGPRRAVPTETGLQFLRREFHGKQQTARVIRQFIALLLPAFLVAWWTRGPQLRAQQKAQWLLQPHDLAYLIVALSILAFCWFAIGNWARRCGQEIEKLGQS